MEQLNPFFHRLCYVLGLLSEAKLGVQEERMEYLKLAVRGRVSTKMAPLMALLVWWISVPHNRVPHSLDTGRQICQTCQPDLIIPRARLDLLTRYPADHFWTLPPKPFHFATVSEMAKFQEVIHTIPISIVV